MRKTVTIGALSLVVIVVALLGIDTGFAINAERSFARALMTSLGPDGRTPALRYEPEVTISGFPATRSIADGRYSAIGITARAVDATGTATFDDFRFRSPEQSHECSRSNPCHADVRSRLTDVRTGGRATMTRPFGPEMTLKVGSATASTTLDSVAVGRFLGIDDLTINTPAATSVAGGGGPQDGLLSRTTGILLTGTVRTPATGDRDLKVSVNVDLSIRGGLLHLQATDYYNGPEEHSKTVVAPEFAGVVLSRFTATLPSLPMAWGATATSARSSGSDLMVEGPANPEVFALSSFLNASDVYYMYYVGPPR